ncbi:22497_t:CDS:2 [Cetraspora pellucida]|uniref:22497_t:CDS:1 n=1 Tax=Cetraspora pellucida TaxID=1433469 RepID=A0A9N8ZPF4_9GLOM|nr:22497_t:CDS:2 [Cetraspora pellucida]
MEHNKRSNRLVKAKEYLQTIQDRFCKLQQNLVSKKDYIKYLEKEISIQDKELNPLRSEISNLIKQLEKVFKESKNRENYIAYLEKQQYFQSPVTIAPTINSIIDYLNIISDASNRFERLVLDIYPQVNTRAINAENQVANLQTQLANSQTQLADLQTQLTDSQTQLAMLQNDYNLLHQAYGAHRTQHNIFKSRELDSRITICMQKRQISKLLAEKFTLCLLNRRTQKQLQNCEADRATTAHLLNLTRNRYIKWKKKCKTLKNDLLLANVQLDLKWGKWKAQTRNSEQLINNLNQQIFQLQNNPPILANMATIQEVMAVITPLIAPILQYIGQEPPEDYVNKIKQLYNCGSTVDVVAGFNDAVKTQILASKMGEKYILPNPFNNQAEVLNTEYQRNNIGTQQITTQRLTQEKFMSYDTPKTYETKIKPFLLGVPINNNYVLGVLKNQLPTELYNRITIAPPADILAFFTRGSIYTNGISQLASFQPIIQLQFQQNFQNPSQPQNFQTSSQPVIQPQLQKNIPPPLPPGHEYQLEEFHMNNFMDDQARQIRIGITPTPLSKLPPGEKIIHPKSEKAKALQEIMDYPRLGLDIEDERPYDPMEIDLAIVNIARRIGGNTTIPTTNIVNASQTVRKKKPPVRKRVIKKEEEVYEEIVYENEDNENVEYIEVEDRPEEMLCNNSTIEQKVIEICKKNFQNELRNILNEFKTLLSSYNLSPELASSMALDEPMDINLVRRPTNDLTTAECRINNILIPKAVLDGGAQCTMISKKLARHLGLKIDTTNPPSLEGVATDASSYGWCYNVPIIFTNRALTRDTDYTMIHDVIVSNYDKYALIIGTDWLDLAGGKVDYEKHEFRVGNTFVPISVHRSNIKEECINQFFQDICAYAPTLLLEYDLPSFSSNA